MPPGARLSWCRRPWLRPLPGLGLQELHHNAGGALTRTLDAFRVLLVGSRPAQVGDAAGRYEADIEGAADLSGRRRLHVNGDRIGAIGQHGIESVARHEDVTRG